MVAGLLVKMGQRSNAHSINAENTSQTKKLPSYLLERKQGIMPEHPDTHFALPTTNETLGLGRQTCQSRPAHPGYQANRLRHHINDKTQGRMVEEWAYKPDSVPDETRFVRW